MASKTINISQEVFDLLRARKGQEESYTEVIRRLIGERSLRELAGILTEKQASGLRRAVEEGRARSRKRRASQQLEP